jgi:succinate dehydrogenase / fumarate reductase cytochrome b subunit
MPEVTLKKTRPVWYNLSPVNQPLPAIVSILHRISGFALFVGLAWLLYLLDASLASAESFDRFKAIVSHPLAKLVLLGFIWAYLHHFCAGIRFLMHDMHKADALQPARKTAGTVLAVSLVLTVLLGVAIW